MRSLTPVALDEWTSFAPTRLELEGDCCLRCSQSKSRELSCFFRKIKFKSIALVSADACDGSGLLLWERRPSEKTTQRKNLMMMIPLLICWFFFFFFFSCFSRLPLLSSRADICGPGALRLSRKSASQVSVFSGLCNFCLRESRLSSSGLGARASCRRGSPAPRAAANPAIPACPSELHPSLGAGPLQCEEPPNRQLPAVQKSQPRPGAHQ